MNVNECNLLEHINVFVKSMIDNGLEISNSMLRVNVTESLS